MKLLEKLVNNNNKEITLDELKEIWWCCQTYQCYLPSRESCGSSCPAHRGVDFFRGYDHGDTLCGRCTWSKLRDLKIPKELQEYSHIYTLRSHRDARAHPDFQEFFNRLREKFGALCEKANRALQRCHGKYSPPREYCYSCPLQVVCS